MISAEKLKKRVQTTEAFHGAEDSIFIQDPKGVRKMSEIILEFARPLLDEVDSFDDYKKVILMAMADFTEQSRAISPIGATAMFAWNLALDDESETNSKLETLCNDLVPTSRDGFCD